MERKRDREGMREQLDTKRETSNLKREYTVNLAKGKGGGRGGRNL